MYLERIIFIDLVSESDSVNEGEFEPDVGFLEFVGVCPEAYPREVVRPRVIVEWGVEKRVHEGTLTDTRFPDAQNIKTKPGRRR